ncbi:MAG: hypothetical protein GY715_18135 [Planctomycetes bacterium]|nr:hypothetical protein [Planctomycetota bacterium]
MTLSTDGRTPGAGAERRVSVLTADRMCASCGYNLVGQMVVREPHYGMLIVRCPECAAVASVQEYPLLGRWAGRWGAILAALWFIFLVAMWPLTSAIVFGWTATTSEEAARGYGQYLRTHHREDMQRERDDAIAKKATETGAAEAATPIDPVQAQAAQMLASIGSNNSATRRAIGQVLGVTVNDDFPSWWATQDGDALLAEAGGWSEMVNRRAFWIWVPAALTVFCVGWFWSLALLRLRRRWALAWGVAIMALAAVFSGALYMDWMDDDPGWYWHVSQRFIAPRVALMTYVFCAFPLAAGLLFGRPVTRFFIRALLPPSLRGALAYVWTAEGLELPPDRRR